MQGMTGETVVCDTFLIDAFTVPDPGKIPAAVVNTQVADAVVPGMPSWMHASGQYADATTVWKTRHLYRWHPAVLQ